MTSGDRPTAAAHDAWLEDGVADEIDRYVAGGDTGSRCRVPSVRSEIAIVGSAAIHD